MDGGNLLVMNSKVFKPCHIRYSDYTPCQDQNRAMKFPRENMTYRERHCPAENEKLHCLIPAPKGYVTPFPWPKSRDYVPYANAPYKSLAVEKAVQNWIQYQGDVFHFPGGGTMFPNGASAYIDELASVIPLADGTIRTALDTGCGVCLTNTYFFHCLSAIYSIALVVVVSVASLLSLCCTSFDLKCLVHVFLVQLCGIFTYMIRSFFLIVLHYCPEDLE
jgi:hypothetical protein